MTLTSGSSLQGLVLNKSQFDMQLLGDDRKIHLLRMSGALGTTSTTARAVTSQTNWTSYNGGDSGSRYSTLSQIRPLLTPDQQKKLDAVQKAHQDMMNAHKELHDALQE